MRLKFNYYLSMIQQFSEFFCITLRNWCSFSFLHKLLYASQAVAICSMEGYMDSTKCYLSTPFSQLNHAALQFHIIPRMPFAQCETSYIRFGFTERLMNIPINIHTYIGSISLIATIPVISKVKS